jgi:hypothetical protein
MQIKQIQYTYTISSQKWGGLDLFSPTLLTHFPALSFQKSYCIHNYIQWLTAFLLYRVIKEERSIFWEVVALAIVRKKVHMNMCLILNGYGDRVVWISPLKCAQLSEPCSVQCNVSQVSVDCCDIVWCLKCCKTCDTSSHMLNMQISCMSMVFVMEAPLLLLKNTVDSFLLAEFWIEACFPKFLTNSVKVVHFSTFTFHLIMNINKMWMKLKIFFSWYSIALLLAHEEFLCALVFHRQEYGEH